ncbi:hypothetical protein [Qipengyuania sp. MTN3-11]|uniref:hypothetical protein n=1 Tax=Qipengyuania sp. MTN3-11 TaxID=3056557 RepID=UPI0036F3EF1D
MTQVAVIDPRDITITPVFKIIEVENVHASEKAGHAVMETKEVVEVRFAGSRNYSPVFPSDAQYRKEGNRSITYAERWSDQYRDFKQGNPQEAMGTPLEMLRPYGVTPELVSLCRAMKIYSIESLHALEGQGLKSLGMNANRLKDAARAFMSERLSSSAALSEVEQLRARIAELEASSVQVPASEPTPDEQKEALAVADKAFAEMSDDDIKSEIAELAGSRPRGTPSRETLENSLRELREAKAA